MKQDCLSIAKVCPICGGGNISEREESQSFPVDAGGQVFVEAVVPVMHCQDCGFSYTDGRAEARRHDAVCRELEILSPSEIRQIREEIYGMSRRQFADAFDIGEASLERWENGKIFQNKQADNYLKLLKDTRVGQRVIANKARAAATKRTEPHRHPAVDHGRFRALKVTAELEIRAAEFYL